MNNTGQGSTPLLEVDALSVAFRQYKNGSAQQDLRVISDLNLTLRAGEILAVAGSSGSGKSLLAQAVMGVLPKNAQVGGKLYMDGETLTPARQATLRGRDMAWIPQNVLALDPLMKAGAQVQEAKRGEAARQKQAFARLGLEEKDAALYPFQLSGGMARRVLFATAMVSGARLILADEPTPGMHVEQAKEALQVLRELADEGKGVLLITHDIDLALGVADRVAVFYAGTTLEQANVADFGAQGETALRHPYSKALWRAMPQNGFVPLPGFQPYATHLPPGCLFAPRCSLCSAACMRAVPPMRALRSGMVRCVHAT